MNHGSIASPAYYTIHSISSNDIVPSLIYSWVAYSQFVHHSKANLTYSSISSNDISNIYYGTDNTLSRRPYTEFIFRD